MIFLFLSFLLLFSFSFVTITFPFHPPLTAIRLETREEGDGVRREHPGNFDDILVTDTSLESGLSEDYAIPPDALSSTSLESSMPSLLMRVSGESPKKQESLEKTGHLAKLGGKLKTWRKRWFVLKNGVLTYWKSQNDVNRKPQGQIVLDEVCR